MANRPQRQVSASLVIVEQPASRVLRFRYPSDARGRSAGSVPGVNSTPENKTFPTIKICGYEGPVKIVVSCVTKDEPYRPHSHNLVGRECEKGIFVKDMKVTKEANTCQFKNLGIQCVKRADIPAALKLRKELRVDPFRTGFDHMNHPQSIDLNAVRLAFQVLIPDSNGDIRYQLGPVCSDIIYDKMTLRIMKTSNCTGTVRGGTEIILLCDKVAPEDTVVVFYEEEKGQVVWEQAATIMSFHKQVAIVFTTPPYRNQLVTEPVNVFFQLKRLSDDNRSRPASFEYTPDDQVYAQKKLEKKILSSCLKYQADDKIEYHQMRRMSSSDHGSLQYDQDWRVPIDPPMDFAIPGTSRSDIHWPELDTLSPNVNHMDHVSPQFEALSINMDQASSNLATHTANNIMTNLEYTPTNMSQITPNLVPVSQSVDQIMVDLVYTSANMSQLTPIASNVGQLTQDYRYTSFNNPSSSSQVTSKSVHISPGMDHLMHDSQSTSNKSPLRLDSVRISLDQENSKSGLFPSNFLQRNSNQMPMDEQNTQGTLIEIEGLAQMQDMDSGAMSVSSLSSIPLGDYNSDSDNLNKLSYSDLLQP